jgi:hypothetical protein
MYGAIRRNKHKTNTKIAEVAAAIESGEIQQKRMHQAVLKHTDSGNKNVVCTSSDNVKDLIVSGAT